MASPADFMQSVTLSRVAAIRTSGDYRYRTGNAALWCWLLHGNAFARALGLPVFKDVFLSSRQGSGWDGDPLAEVEALLAALSAGPVGIGDRLGRTDRELVMRTCREDGVLVKPDAPVAALDRCYRTSSFADPVLLHGETHSRHAAGCWTYWVAMHASLSPDVLGDRVPLSELGASAPEGPVIVRDWRSGELQRCEPGDGLDTELAPREWRYRILCPLLPGGIAIFGDPSKYVSAGDRRLRQVRAETGELRFDVLGAPGEHITIAGWSERPLCATWSDGEEHPLLSRASGAGTWHRSPASGEWRLDVTVGERGFVHVRLTGS